MDHLTLSGGRRLDFRVHGPDDGPVLVAHHGTPGAGTPDRSFERATAARGLRLVTMSRAGYGGSGRHLRRRVVDVVKDTREVLDHLAARECIVIGRSGGGPHALACAARLEHTRAAATLASVAPYDAEGLHFTDGMGEDNIVEFGAAAEGEAVLRPLLAAWAPRMIEGTPEALIESMESLLPDADLAVLTGEYAEDLVAMVSEALDPGVDGWVDDDLAFVSGWGFDLDEIDVPVAVWAGGKDLMVPFAHGRWLAEHVPGATAHLHPEEGHLSIRVLRVGEILDDLMAAADWL